MHAVTQLLHDLVAIDSINPDLVPGSAGESAIAAFIADWLRAAGLDVEIDEPSPGRPSVVGIARGSGGGRSLMLNAHVDTVGVAGMEQPHTPRIEGNRLYGRGAYDMKGGLAAIMIAGAEATKHDLRGDVIVTAVADEEYASLGTESIVKRWRADAAIVTEPTQLQICLAHKGFTWLEIETRGVAAHGSKPDLGVDAIAKMGQVLVGLEALDRSLRSESSHPLLHSGSLHASLISGGQELSSYPERCTLMVERRTIPGETQAIVEAQIKELLVENAARDAGFQATLRTTFERLPFEVAADEPIVVELLRQARGILGAEPNLVGETPWMDSAILSAAGIPTVVFGPSGTGAHAVVEWVDLESVDRCAQVLLATALEFCK
ncbi:MAG TPA: ArgE/DapE family deacylase [Herpetosiphonaceae bacterium]